jgi:hypothetical protein
MNAPYTYPDNITQHMQKISFNNEELGTSNEDHIITV